MRRHKVRTYGEALGAMKKASKQEKDRVYKNVKGILIKRYGFTGAEASMLIEVRKCSRWSGPDSMKSPKAVADIIAKKGEKTLRKIVKGKIKLE